MNNYIKNYAIWLGGGLILSFILSFLIYLPLLYWAFLIAGTIVGTVQTQKEEGAHIKFSSAVKAVLLVLGTFYLLGIIRVFIIGGFEYFGHYLMYFSEGIFMTVVITVGILLAVGAWYMFEKADKPGWAILVPIYNMIVFLEIAQKPTWWIAMFFIPIVNIVFMVMMYDAISKKFGKDSGFTVGLVFLNSIFFAILGYGDAKYQPEKIVKRDDTLLDNY